MSADCVGSEHVVVYGDDTCVCGQMVIPIQQLRADLEAAVTRNEELQRGIARTKRRITQDGEVRTARGEARKAWKKNERLETLVANYRKFEVRMKAERHVLGEALKHISAGPYTLEECREFASEALTEARRIQNTPPAPSPLLKDGEL